MEETNENRLLELESRIAFQEDAIQKLDDALTHQQQQLMDMQRLIELIMQQLTTLVREIPDEPEPPPPHY